LSLRKQVKAAFRQQKSGSSFPFLRSFEEILKGNEPLAATVQLTQRYIYNVVLIAKQDGYLAKSCTLQDEGF